MKQVRYAFDTAAIFKHYGGARGVHAALSDLRRPPGLAAVRGWLKRRSIPSPWIATLLCELHKKSGINPLKLIVPHYTATAKPVKAAKAKGLF